MVSQELACNELEEFEQDSKWFYRNAQSLQEKFVGKFVAVKNKAVIASDSKFDVVVKEVTDKGNNPACIVIEFVHPKGTVILF